MTEFEKRLYADYVAHYEAEEAAGRRPLTLFLSPENFVQQRKDLAEERKIVAARGGRDFRSIHQEMLERITVVSLRSAQVDARHAKQYLNKLSKEQLEKLAAKNPEITKFANMGQREIQEYLRSGGRKARAKLYAALPSKKKRSKQTGKYYNIPIWIDSP